MYIEVNIFLFFLSKLILKMEIIYQEGNVYFYGMISFNFPEI